MHEIFFVSGYLLIHIFYEFSPSKINIILSNIIDLISDILYCRLPLPSYLLISKTAIGNCCIIFIFF